MELSSMQRQSLERMSEGIVKNGCGLSSLVV